MITDTKTVRVPVHHLWDHLAEILSHLDGDLGVAAAQIVDEFEVLVTWYRQVIAESEAATLSQETLSQADEYWLPHADIMQLMFDRMEQELTAIGCPLTADYYRLMARLAMVVGRKESLLAETAMEEQLRLEQECA